MRGLVAFAVFVALGVPVFANDSSAELGAGGLVFVRNENIRMASEVLYLSMDEVRVTYEFENLTDEDQSVYVAFPMPDITGELHGTTGYPTNDPANIFGFTTTFDGLPVDSELHQYAFALGVNRTKELQKYGLSLAPHLGDTEHAINVLPREDKQALAAIGLVKEEPWGEVPYYLPVWTLKSAYTWEAVFPAGETVVVEHKYTPGVGGASSVGFLNDDSSLRSHYESKYCVDEPVINAVRRNLADPDQPWSAPYYETWLSYVLSTGGNWAGPIGEFKLIIDKGKPENLVALCAENLVKTSPTTFEMTATDFWPWSDIHVLFLVRYDP